MPCRSDCAHSYPVRARRCRLSRGRCEGCRDFVGSDIEREPTEHPWILTTNKYFKNNMGGKAYEKGIITNGITYTMYVLDCDTHIYFEVTSSKRRICNGAVDNANPFSFVIKMCEAAIRCQITIDAKEVAHA